MLFLTRPPLSCQDSSFPEWGTVRSLTTRERRWRNYFSILLGSTAVKAGVSPFLQHGNTACQLRDGRLIDPSPGSLDEFCIELAMIDSGLSRYGADEGAVLVPQFVLLIMQRDCRLWDALALTA